MGAGRGLLQRVLSCRNPHRAGSNSFAGFMPGQDDTQVEDWPATNALGLDHGLNVTAESGFRLLWLVVSEDYNFQDLLA